MNAAEVLADSCIGDDLDDVVEAQVDALLAHGEQGVAILPDGTLWAIKGRDPDGTDRLCVLAPIPDDGGGWGPPVSAEAGDTP